MRVGSRVVETLKIQESAYLEHLLDYAAEDQKIEAFYQKSSPSKEKGIIFFQNAKLGHLIKVKFLVLFR